MATFPWHLSVSPIGKVTTPLSKWLSTSRSHCHHRKRSHPTHCQEQLPPKHGHILGVIGASCLPILQRRKSCHRLGIGAIYSVQKTSVDITELKSQFSLFHSSVKIAHFLSGQKTDSKWNSTPGAGQLDRGHEGPGFREISTMESIRVTSLRPQPLPFPSPSDSVSHSCAHGLYSHGPF